jgi:acyl carrier protein
MTEAEVVARIQRIFVQTLNVAPPAPETDIIETALLDSLALVTLLFGIEEEFGKQIPLESLEIDDFRTIERIARLIDAQESAQ